MKIEIPNEIKTKNQQLSYLKENKEQLIQMKKATLKTGVASAFVLPATQSKNTSIGLNTDSIRVTAIINTTNWMDSHDDVHLKGCFNKTVKEGRPMHLQEHQMQFDKIIASGKDVNAYVAEYNLKDLGYKYDYTVEGYTFETIARKERNEYMFNQYLKGYVENHSIGMNYIKLILAITEKSDDWAEEYEAWERYKDQIINIEQAEQKGYCWFVQELKAIEGSAVPIGSNIITPTTSIEAVSDDTSKTYAPEPSFDTLKQTFSNFLKQSK